MSHSFNYRRFYDAVSGVYAWGMWLLPMWRRYTEAALPWLPESGTILEIGPGAGLLHTLLARKYPVTLALDLSTGMLRETRTRLTQIGKPARLMQAQAQQIPLRSSCVDGLVLTFVFSAIPDGAGTMREFARVLRPGGVIVMVDACEPANGNPVAVWLARQWEHFGDSIRDESALMRAAGLEIAHRHEFGAFSSIRITVGQRPHTI